MKILLVEDNVKLNQAIATFLSDGGFEVATAHNGVQGINKIKDDKRDGIEYDIIILDRMMPMKDGIEVVKELRDILPNVGIIMLTAKDTVEDKVAGLAAGADDYIIKPFDVKELIARIHALYRRTSITSSNLTREAGSINLKDKDFKFNASLNELECKNKKAELTGKEAEIFSLLLKNVGEVVSKDDLFEKVWHEDADEKGEDFNPRQIDVHVHNLRNKLEDINFPGVVDTVRGVGYKLVF